MKGVKLFFPIFHFCLTKPLSFSPAQPRSQDLHILMVPFYADNVPFILAWFAGLLTDAKLRPEIATLAPHIATWKDCFKCEPRATHCSNIFLPF